MSKFGQELRALRMRHGLTLRDVAQAANRSVSSISDVEHSRRPPLKASEITAMCDRLNIRGEVEQLMNAAIESQGSVTVESPSDLEKDLLVTLRRSIENRTIHDEELRAIILNLKQRLDHKSNDREAGKHKGEN